MLLVVVDTETTGLNGEDQVCELATATIGTKAINCLDGGTWTNFWLEGAWGTLIRPSCAMSLAARAVHHICDEELAEAPTMSELLMRRGLPEFGWSSEGTRMPHADSVVFVAHNAEFDRRMLRQSCVAAEALPARTICTWRCALHAWPDAESHKNSYLRYYLGVKPAFASDEPPHRAMADVAVTAAILGELLRTYSPEQLIEMSSRRVLLKKVGFGKYTGQLWSDMDVGFLGWILKPRPKPFSEEVLYTAEHWLRKKTER